MNNNEQSRLNVMHFVNRIAFWLLVIAIALFTMVPFFYAISISFRTNTQVLTGATYLPMAIYSQENLGLQDFLRTAGDEERPLPIETFKVTVNNREETIEESSYNSALRDDPAAFENAVVEVVFPEADLSMNIANYEAMVANGDELPDEDPLFHITHGQEEIGLNTFLLLDVVITGRDGATEPETMTITNFLNIPTSELKNATYEVPGIQIENIYRERRMAIGEYFSYSGDEERSQFVDDYVIQDATTQNYRNLFENERFLTIALNSTIVSTLTVLFALITGSFAAYALGRVRFKGRMLIMYLVLAMTMFPQISILSGLFAIVDDQLDIDGSILALLFTYPIFTLPFTVWVLTSFFQGLPAEIEQAALVDGATPFQTFWRVLVPLTAPALVTTGLLAFIAAWNEYLFALTFTISNDKAKTIPVEIANFAGFDREVPVADRITAAVVVTVPLLILVLMFQRRIIEGLTAGAVKG